MALPWGTIFKRPPAPASPTRQSEKPDALPKLFFEAQEVLYALSTVFPFVLFADKIIIRPNHVDVAVGVFFGSGTATRIQIRDIKQVTLQYNPFFATIEIIPQGPLEQTFRVSFLWKDQAIRAKRIIAGLVECHQQNVNFSKYAKKDLVEYLVRIGKGRE